jgi:predicted flap endonuclease-1-like 5' DNA nuclease
MTSLHDIEGIAEGYVTKLAAAGITSVETLLAQGATPEGRKAIAEASGLGDAHVLKWVNHADLFRIKGIAGERAELLEATGVDTVKELAQRNAENLAAAMEKINEAKQLVRQVPGAAMVADWINQAKELPRAVSH